MKKAIPREMNNNRPIPLQVVQSMDRLTVGDRKEFFWYHRALDRVGDSLRGSIKEKDRVTIDLEKLEPKFGDKCWITAQWWMQDEC